MRPDPPTTARADKLVGGILRANLRVGFCLGVEDRYQFSERSYPGPGYCVEVEMAC
jgi:hypothetical protein